MKKTLIVFGLTLMALALLDLGVAQVLGWAERSGRLGSMVQYFDYGRSVPGKLAQWEADPERPGNLFDVAWRSDVLAASEASFQAEALGAGPVIRSYGMSFVNNILVHAVERAPDLDWDPHSGPGAPPNYTFALFEEDRANRRPGDIVVLGILSSSVPAMAALSNRTWVFEQPSPFTYPVYQLAGTGLDRIDPLVTNAAQERALAQDPTARQRWAAQLGRHDTFHAPQTFGAPWLDASPFARLVRRSLATTHIARTKAGILGSGLYPYRDVLERMVVIFAEIARQDGQTPIVMLIQSKQPGDVDLLASLKPVLEAHGITYFATAEYFDPKDPSGFLPDGHYTQPVDQMFAERFLGLLAQ